MIPKPLSQIRRDDIQYLIDNEILENRTIEYKRTIDKSDEASGRFLAGVTSLANTEGGDFVIGIEEDNGKPVRICGLPGEEIDRLKLRLEAYMRDGVDPRLNDKEIWTVETGPNEYVLIIRVKRSWNLPHRVKKGNHFYIRNSAGRNPMDVSELRNMILQHHESAGKMKQFVHERTKMIMADYEVPVSPLKPGGIISLHVIPYRAMISSDLIDMKESWKYGHFIEPLANYENQPFDARWNADGFVTFHPERQDPHVTYAQIFRDGVIETVYCLLESGVYLKWVEYFIVKAIMNYLKFYKYNDIQVPAYAFLSFINMKGFQHLTEDAYRTARKDKIDRDIIRFPDIELSDEELHPGKTLRPLFDMMWNVFGYPSSPNYDKDTGEWKDRKQ